MKLPRRVAAVLLNSLKGGVVPRIGLPYIAVGRKAEIEALLHDVELVAEGGAAFRFLVGRYGSGKSFLLQTIRNYAMDRNFVVVDADLSPERRLQGTRGQGLATYRELIRNMSTRTHPEGGALPLILDRWIDSVRNECAAESGSSPDDPVFRGLVERKIRDVVQSLNELVHGFDFARLLTLYYRSNLEGDETTRANVLKWFRGEYVTRSEARADLGVGVIISDDDWYEYVKLFALFLKRAGYAGLLILIDELVNLSKIPNSITRQYNYEKLLSMYNDVLQGKARHIGILMGGTPQSVEDPRRGVFSYEALKSRLAEGRFGGGEIHDLLAPIIRLQPLTGEEMLILIEKLAEIHAEFYQSGRTVTQQELIAFLREEYGRIGAESHLTVREVIRDFIELLNLALQNPEKGVGGLLAEGALSRTEETSGEAAGGVDGESEAGFEEFEL